MRKSIWMWNLYNDEVKNIDFEIHYPLVDRFKNKPKKKEMLVFSTPTGMNEFYKWHPKLKPTAEGVN